MRLTPADARSLHQWMTLAWWLILGSSVPALLVAAWFPLQRAWIARYGRPAVAVVEKAEALATFPNQITNVLLCVMPEEEPQALIRIRMAWSARVILPELLTPGSTHRVRYRRAARSIAMPDARPQPRG